MNRLAQSATVSARRRRLLESLERGPEFPQELAERLRVKRSAINNDLLELEGRGLVRRVQRGWAITLIGRIAVD